MRPNLKRIIPGFVVALFFLASTVCVQALAPDIKLSKNSGFYEKPFSLKISSHGEQVAIYYTLDGSDPREYTASSYTSPINIIRTTVLRSVARDKQGRYSPIATRSFLFLDDIVVQNNSPEGYPDNWGAFTSIPGLAPADYEMDPEITQSKAYKNKIKAALKALPSLSLVTDRAHLFSLSDDENTGGIYTHTGAPIEWKIDAVGKGWERPTTAELFDKHGKLMLSVDAGLRIHGGHSRRPEKSPKHSFRIVFRKDYGDKYLRYPFFGSEGPDRIKSIVLRAGYGNSLYHWLHSGRVHAQYIRDVWMKETFAAMGQPAGKGSYVHLYLNGIYWGIYNPTERMDKHFAQYQLGGKKSEFDILKDYEEVAEGSRSDWDNLLNQAKHFGGRDHYIQLIEGAADGSRALIDPENLADYMLLNFYGGNWDWDAHNWVVIRNRKQNQGFKFLTWDAEHVLEDPQANITDKNSERRASGVFQTLMAEPEFKLLFADRVQKHCGPGGALSSEAAAARWQVQAKKLELAFIAETARWGDYRRDVHPYVENEPKQLYTLADWENQRRFMLEEYFPQRTQVLLKNLAERNMLTNVSTPSFWQKQAPIKTAQTKVGRHGLSVHSDGELFISLDGSDPREQAQSHNGELSKKTLEKVSVVKARTHKNGEWSALAEMLLEH